MTYPRSTFFTHKKERTALAIATPIVMIVTALFPVWSLGWWVTSALLELPMLYLCFIWSRPRVFAMMAAQFLWGGIGTGIMRAMLEDPFSGANIIGVMICALTAAPWYWGIFRMDDTHSVFSQNIFATNAWQFRPFMRAALLVITLVETAIVAWQFNIIGGIALLVGSIIVYVLADKTWKYNYTKAVLLACLQFFTVLANASVIMYLQAMGYGFYDAPLTITGIVALDLLLLACVLFLLGYKESISRRKQ